MFTGLVTAVGRVAGTREDAGVRELTIEAPYPDLVAGESVAVAGACLTVVGVEAGRFRVEVIPTTRERTRLGELAVGDHVNLERALAAGDRLGGHVVQGHVDGVARVTAAETSGDTAVVDLEVPEAVARVCVPLGAITVDGVSLTVNALPTARTIQVSLIPYTREHTTLGALRVGSRVHVEADLVGKYVQRLLEPYRGRER